MATSFHATYKSCRGSLRRRNTRNWALQRSSTTASMSRTLCRAQNNRKSTLLCFVFVLPPAFVATLIMRTLTWMSKVNPTVCVCVVVVDVRCPLSQQSAVLQADPQTPQQAATSRPQTCQRKTVQESPLQMWVQCHAASFTFKLTHNSAVHISSQVKWDSQLMYHNLKLALKYCLSFPVTHLSVWAFVWLVGFELDLHDRFPSRWRVCPTRCGIHPTQTQTEKAQRSGGGRKSRKVPKTQQRHVGTTIQRRGKQRFRGQHERPLSSSVQSFDVVTKPKPYQEGIKMCLRGEKLALSILFPVLQQLCSP